MFLPMSIRPNVIRKIYVPFVDQTEARCGGGFEGDGIHQPPFVSGSGWGVWRSKR